MIPTVTKLRNKKSLFPEDKVDGDIVINPHNEMFVFAKKQWHLIGGRFIDPELLYTIVKYLRSGWAPADVMVDDLMGIIGEEATKPMPPKDKKFAPLSPFWYSAFLDNVLKVAEKLD